MVRDKQILGVIGGLGPLASAYFLELMTRMTEADRDQDHLEVILRSCPGIPDRTAHLLNPEMPSPVPMMTEIGNQLVRMGAEKIAIPCMTAHSFLQQLQAGIPVPVLDAVTASVSLLADNSVRRAGILATDGTIRSGLFAEAMKKRGITPVVPSAKEQENVMHLIYHNIKAGRPVEMDRFWSVSRELKRKGAEVVVLGCTELSLIQREQKLGPGYLDALEVLANLAVTECGAESSWSFRTGKGGEYHAKCS